MKATHETARPDRAAAGRAPGEEGVLPPPRLHGNVMVSGLIPSGRQLTLAAIRTQRGEGPMFGYGWCGGMGAGGWVLMAVLWGGFLAVVVWAVTRLFPGGRSREGNNDSAASVLDRRLATGEIDEDTYRRLRG